MFSQSTVTRKGNRDEKPEGHSLGETMRMMLSQPTETSKANSDNHLQKFPFSQKASKSEDDDDLAKLLSQDITAHEEELQLFS